MFQISGYSSAKKLNKLNNAILTYIIENLDKLMLFLITRYENIPIFFNIT